MMEWSKTHKNMVSAFSKVRKTITALCGQLVYIHEPA